jgi:hypothetical protein
MKHFFLGLLLFSSLSARAQVQNPGELPGQQPGEYTGQQAGELPGQQPGEIGGPSGDDWSTTYIPFNCKRIENPSFEGIPYIAGIKKIHIEKDQTSANKICFVLTNRKSSYAESFKTAKLSFGEISNHFPKALNNHNQLTLLSGITVNGSMIGEKRSESIVSQGILTLSQSQLPKLVKVFTDLNCRLNY